MRGNVTKRGRASWRVKFELPRGGDGKRHYQVVTVRGKRRDAEQKLTELLAAVDRGAFVKPTKITIGEHVSARIDQWEAACSISSKTAERYRELLVGQIGPHLGKKMMQQLKPADIEIWHNTLRTNGRKDGTGGVGPYTIRGAHRLLSQALKDAVRFDMTVRNVAGKNGQTAPRMSTEEMRIIPKDRIGDVISGLRGRAVYTKAITALFTGLRRGELLALRWHRISFETKILEIREALEETKAHGIRFKATKTKSGRRDIELPDIAIDALRDHRRQQLEMRLALGLGKLPEHALVFPARDGGPQSPRNLSGDWLEAARAIGLGDIGFHNLRHTHASMLIAGKIDIVRISKRLGHAKPSITLSIYAHLFEQRDEQSAAVINATLTALGSN